MIPRKSSSPIDEKRRELASRQAELEQERQRLERLIKEYPARLEQEKIRLREEWVSRAAGTGARRETPSSLRAVTDREWPAPIKHRPRLRSEMHTYRLRFFALVAVLAILLLILISRLGH